MTDYTDVDALIDDALRVTSGSARSNEMRREARNRIHERIRRADIAARERDAISAELDKQIAEVVRLTVALKVAEGAKTTAPKPETAPVVDVKHAASLERASDPGLPGMGFMPNHMKPWWMG